ncbi:hypothetical protein Tco_0092582, partial [Tanacetum coccineum]
MVKESLEDVVLAKEECYEGLIKSYDLNKTLFFYPNDNVNSLKRSRKDKDKDEDPSAGSDRGLKKRKTSKDVEPKKVQKLKNHSLAYPKAPSLNQNLLESLFSQRNQSLRLQIQICHKIKRRTRVMMMKNPRERLHLNMIGLPNLNDLKNPTDPDWNDGKIRQQGPTQSWLMTLASSADKPSKTFDELMSTPIDFSTYIMNDLKISNLTQETLLGPAFKLLKGTRSNYAELEYDFEECYKALSEKLDWDNPEGGDYPFHLTKPLPLVMNRNRQMVPVDYFFNNDLKYLQGGISTITYTTSLTKTKAAQYDLPGIEDMVLNIWSPVKVAYDKHALWGISHWRDQRKSFYGYAQGLESSHDVYFYQWLTNLSSNDVSDSAIALRMLTISMVIQTRVEDLQCEVKSYQKMIYVTKARNTKPDIGKRDTYHSISRPSRISFYVDNKGRRRKREKKKRLCASNYTYGLVDGTLTGLLTSIWADIIRISKWISCYREDGNQRDLPRDIPLDSVEVLRFDTSAGNPVKEILLKLNYCLRLLALDPLTEFKVTPTKHRRMTNPYSSPRFIANYLNARYLKMEVKPTSSSFVSIKGSTSIGVPKVSSTSSGRVTDGVYDSIDGRTCVVHYGLGLSTLSSIISKSPIGSSSNHAMHL